MPNAIHRANRRLKRAEERSNAVAPPAAYGTANLFDWAHAHLRDSFPDESSDFHVWLAAELDGLRDGRGSRRNILAPRGNAKSTWVSYAYPLREALEGREGLTVIISDSARKASGMLRKISRAVKHNESIRDRYGVMVGERWQDSHIELKNGCEVMAIGAGGSIRGTSAASNRRPTLILCDDIEKKDHIHSALRRERSWEWFTKDVLPAGEPSTNIVVVGTALHRDCIVCKLENTAGWKSRTWKSIVEWPSRMDLWAEWEAILHDWQNEDREGEARRFYEAHKGEMDS